MKSEQLEEIYRRRAGDIYRMSFVYLKNHVDAEDAVTEVFLKYMTKMPRFESEQHEKAWFFRVTINYCKDQLKKKKWQADNLDGLEDLPGTSLTGAEKQVLEEVLALPVKLRQAVYMHYYLGYTLKEIGKITATAETTIRARLFKARKLLKDCLEDLV